MWPVILDMTKEESMQSLRNLELQAYSHLVSALRAQGALNTDKKKLLRDTSQALNISHDRHKAEVRRAINDEKLNTIAYHITGTMDTTDDWAQEGRRTVPLLPRMAPQTAYSAIADEVAENTSLINKQLPPPACTERKRPATSAQVILPETSKMPFRVPDNPKSDDANKKRKIPIENSTLAQHLLGSQPKINRTQAIYRHRPNKTVLNCKETKLKVQSKVPFSPLPNKISNLEETIEQIQNEVNAYKPDGATTNENQAPRNKLLTPTRLNFKQVQAGPSSSCEPQKSFKLTPQAKKLTKTITTTNNSAIGQKLIVVSNSQTIHSNSILQKSLSLPLVKNISVKNLDKFKIVTTSSPSHIVTSGGAHLNSFKHKVVTVKTNPKKMIPLSLLNSKGGIKVLPIGGKIVGKTTTTNSSPMYIVNAMSTPKTVATVVNQSQMATIEVVAPVLEENGAKSAVLGDILKASGVTHEDYDTQITGFRIPNNNNSSEVESDDGVKQCGYSGVEEEIETSEKGDFVVLPIEDCVMNDSVKELDVLESEVVVNDADMFVSEEIEIDKSLGTICGDEETVILPVECSDYDLIQTNETANEIVD